MSIDVLFWMNYSIEIAKTAKFASIKVGAVLVAKNNQLICSSYSGEVHDVSWGALLLSKARELNITSAQSIFVTVNTLTKDRNFELNLLLNSISVDDIYVGLPDPSLTCYLEDDPIIMMRNSKRYPDELQRQILQQNKKFFGDSQQSIANSKYYFDHRISNLVMELLNSKGLMISKDELNEHKGKLELALLICSKFDMEQTKAIDIVQRVLAEAFNKKYGHYEYSEDTRSLNPEWETDFSFIYHQLSDMPISNHNVLNVGVGGGQEAVMLFSSCEQITFVDIASTGLLRIKEHMPGSNIIVSSAEELSALSDNEFTLYVSLRTYNSSFFDMKKAVFEAKRVLKSSGIMIISVANGFLCSERHSIIPGLIIPGTDFVDIYRGIGTIKQLNLELIQAGFKNIQIKFTNTEIYISAVSV